MTQGDPASPMIFIVVVYAVVQAVLGVVCSMQESHNGMVCEARERNLVFYMDDGSIVGRDHEWLQDALTVMVAVLYRMGLEDNHEKTNVMVCTPGFI